MTRALSCCVGHVGQLNEGHRVCQFRSFRKSLHSKANTHAYITRKHPSYICNLDLWDNPPQLLSSSSEETTPFKHI
jgi:hypothetical protein